MVGDVLVWLVVFVLSVTLHEAAHALVGYLGGDLTAYQAGQVTLNPIPHAQREPVGMVLAPLVSVWFFGWPMGWASAPYDPSWEQRYPRRAAWMAAAGPGANLLLVVLALACLRVGLATETFAAPDYVNFSRLVVADTQLLDNLGRFLAMLIVLNSVLFLFNLIPVPPLDGVAILTLPLPDDLALRIRETLRKPALSLIGLLLAWRLFGAVFEPVFDFIVKLVHPALSYS